jgi:hypothetical protein
VKDKGVHKFRKPRSALGPMQKWRRDNWERYQKWRRTYKQTKKSNSRNKARRVLLKSGRAKKCGVCGVAPKYLEVHHKDGNMYNNSLSNLSWRCTKHNPRGRGASKKVNK